MFPGWVIVKGIPYDVWAGMFTGKYDVAGGIIRSLASSDQAKEVVRWFIPLGKSLIEQIPGLEFIPALVKDIQIDLLTQKIDDLSTLTRFNTYQLFQLSSQVNSLSQATQQVLQLVTGTAVLSGLSLVVSSVGFLAIDKKLKIIDKRLQEIQKDVQEIRQFLERSERAALFTAIDDLQKIEQVFNESQQSHILLSSKEKLKQIHFKYRECLAEAKTIGTAVVNEEYFCLTALAHARCSAELGMLNLACHDLQETYGIWKNHAQRIAKQLLIGDYPERFLASDFVREVPVTTLVQWLDFAYGEKKGFLWIDELRGRINEPWYKKTFTMDGKGLNRAIGIGIEKEKEIIIPTLHKLIARDNVLQGYLAQYQLFETHQMKPSSFELKRLALPETSNGYVILAPEKTSKSSKDRERA